LNSGYNLIADLEAGRLNKVVEQRKVNIKEKIDKTHTVLKSSESIPEDWSIKKSLEI